MEKAYEILKNTFHFDEFRLSQKQVVHRLLVDNENALVLFPTGGEPSDVRFSHCMLMMISLGGKSLTYQLPALCLEASAFVTTHGVGSD